MQFVFFFLFSAFLFQPQAFWSAVEVYDPLLLMLVDFLWTSLPGIIHGYSDQDLPTHLLPSVPVLYTPVRFSCCFRVFFTSGVCTLLGSPHMGHRTGVEGIVIRWAGRFLGHGRQSPEFAVVTTQGPASSAAGSVRVEDLWRRHGTYGRFFQQTA